MLIGYARVSTSDQNPDLQLDALRQAGCEKIFSESKSTRSHARAELTRALAYARAGDTLVVWKLDRLDRTLSQLILLLDQLGERAVAFKSLTEPVDTTTPAGRVLFQIVGAFAEFERSIVRERTMAGLAAARRNGKILGRPRSLDPAKLKIAAAMLRDPAIPVREVAEQLGVSRSTLYRYFPATRRHAK